MAYFHTNVLDNQIKALPTVSTASGSVATFDTDLTENLLECVCEVASGKSVINVTACSKNLLNNDANAFTLTSPYYRQVKMPSIQKVISLTDKDDTVSLSGVWFGVFKKYNDSTSGFYWIINNGTINVRNYDCTDYDYVTVYPTTVIQTLLDRFYVQVESGPTATPYVAFNGNNYNIPLGETLSSGGSFDVLSGILTRSDDTTKQLNANYIQTLNGINNVFADTGDTSVKYLLSVGKKIS